MKVKTLVSVMFGVASLFGAVAAHAEDAPATPPTEGAPAAAAPAAGDKKLLVGADGTIALPVGDFGDGAGLGLGALLRGEFTVMPKLNLTARAGFVYHLDKNNVSFYEIPILLGAKYDLTDAIYGAVELGAVRGTAKADIPLLGSVSSSDTNLAATIGGGYRMNDLDFRLGLHILDLGNAGKSMELVANVGYNFFRG